MALTQSPTHFRVGGIHRRFYRSAYLQAEVAGEDLELCVTNYPMSFYSAAPFLHHRHTIVQAKLDLVF